MEEKISDMHPVQSNEVTQAEPSAVEHPLDEDVIRDATDQDGYEPDTETEEDSDRMPVDGDVILSTTDSRSVCYEGQQQSSSDLTHGIPYRAGKQRESSSEPLMPVDNRVNL